MPWEGMGRVDEDSNIGQVGFWELVDFFGPGNNCSECGGGGEKDGPKIEEIPEYV